MHSVTEKHENLNRILREMDSAAIAFSGGVDSTFLLAAAHEILGSRAIAVTARSCSFPQREFEETTAFCNARGIRQIIIQTDELHNESYRKNPKNRCYYCKHTLFEQILRVAAEEGLSAVAEGSNIDDLGDYRPGLQAIAELGIRSPLREAELTKAEIRALTKEMDLPTWQKPAFACLASRIPYGDEITEEKLRMVERAEQFLRDLGFVQLRVRVHGNVARVELAQEGFSAAISQRNEIVSALRDIGFQYVCLDLQGYRTGSMNEVLANR